MSRIIFGLLIVCAALGAGVWLFWQQTPTSVPARAVALPGYLSPSPMPTEKPIPKSKVAQWVSPDGEITLVLKTREDSPSETTYAFFVKRGGDEYEQPISSQTLVNPAKYVIPFNSWSPDNKHFYVEKHVEGQIKYLVFNASGLPFKNSLFLDVNDYYAQKELKQEFSQVTGWAAPTLLMVKTFEPGTQDGPSYWFDLSNQSFIRLSTHF